MRPVDSDWMKRALALAELGRGKTSPNPLVGAIVVRRGKMIGEGHHAYFGGPHAEVVALRKAGRRAIGATLYVTLEPCSSWGKTPPCVDAVLTSGVRQVVIGSLDPNPVNHGIGVRKLKRAGIKVRTCVLVEEVRKQNQAFFKVMRTGLPYVTLKMAQSLDGKIASPSGESRWISSPASRQFVHELRSDADAVLVGKNTALRDNPELAGTNGGVKPWRVVLDPDLKLRPSARIFKGPQLTFVAVSERKLNPRLKSIHQKGKILLSIPEKKGRLELKSLLQQLARLGAHHLLVEGGGELAWSLIHEGWVDRLVWIVAPKIVGGRLAKTSVEGAGIKKLNRAIPLQWDRVYPLGDDWVLEAHPRKI